ncbi:MAG: methionine ABC transporter permease [Tissierellia bacterium]|nr:methionine ABC transporter permease [Tissierellia bacterium]
MIDTLIQSTLETLYMVFTSAFFAFLIGLPMAIVLFVTRQGGLRENIVIFNIFDFVINIFRSIPFIILLILILPLTTLIVGKSIGSTAAIVPLTFASAPFMARMFEGSFLKIDRQIIEAAKSMGSTNSEIIFKVLIPEAMPYLVSDVTITIINLIGYSAMAGSVGGGGIGSMAIRFGLYNYKIDYLIAAVVTIIILVQLIQIFGTFVSNKINKR